MRVRTKNMSKLYLFLLALGANSLIVPAASAIQAQPVPIPEDVAAAPQININGVGIGTFGYGNAIEGSNSNYRGGVDFSDSAMLVGAAQRLYEGGGIGSMGFGLLAPDTANSGTTGSSLLIHQGFLDYQTESTEWLVGRTDNLASHLVDFPTIREEDLILFTNPLNPFSNGASLEDHRYANVASFTLNQGLYYFENIHAQHLFNSQNPSSNPVAINSYGVTFQYLAAPGMEALTRFPSYGAGFERQINGTATGINQFYAGGVVNINESMTDRVDFRLLDIVNLGTDTSQFQNIPDTYQASYNSASASIRYLHTPFGKPGYQLALTGGYKNYFNVNQSDSFGLALTGVRRLGMGFDAVVQYETQWRGAQLASQYQGQTFENVAEVGLVFNFDATFNEHISPRRTLLNTKHQYIPD